MPNAFKRAFLDGVLRSGLLRGLQLLDFARNALYVLAYHRVDWVDAQPQLDPHNLSATPEQFERQMCLLANEYHPVTSDEVLEAASGGRRLPQRAVLVTVDDGYRDFKEHIQPIASRYGIRPILFVPTAYAGVGIFWWDQLYAALQRSALNEVETPLGIMPLKNTAERDDAFARLAHYMKTTPFDSAMAMLDDLCRELVSEPLLMQRVTLDWDELRELARAGVTIAPHTHTHPALGNINAEQARFEISESQRVIRAEIGSGSELFAYSYGVPEAIGKAGKILRELDCKLAFTMVPGRAHLDTDDRMHLPRIEVNPQVTLGQLQARLTSFYDLWVRR